MAIEKFQKGAFYGGMSEEDRPVKGGDKFMYGENIDVLSDPKIIQLSNALELDIAPTEKPLQMHRVITNDLSRTSEVIVMCEGGVVYQAGNSTAVYTNATLGNFGYPCFSLGDKFYFINSTGNTSAFELNYVTLTDAVSSAWTPTLSHKTLSNNNYYENFSSVVIGQKAFIVLGDIIEDFNATSGVVTTYDWVGEEIVGLVYGGGTIRIFTESGKLHLWDGESETSLETTDLGMRLQNIYEIGGVIYLIPGFKGQDRGLYYLDGYTPKRIVEKTYSTEAGKWKFDIENGIQKIANDRNSLYFIEDTNEGPEKIGFFGKRFEGLPNSYVYENTIISKGTEPGSLECIHYSEGDLYVGWTDSTYGIDKIGTDKNTSGYIEMNPEDFDTGIYRKGSKHIKMRVEDIDSTHTIKIEESIDGGSYTTLITKSTQPEDNVIRIHLKGDFRESKLKITLTSDDSTSPKIYFGYEYAYEIKDI